jgi:hypothetical protein
VAVDLLHDSDDDGGRPPPSTDNIATTDIVNKQGVRARVFGSFFIGDWIFEACDVMPLPGPK